LSQAWRDNGYRIVFNDVGKMNRVYLAGAIQLGFALVLIALVFTNAFSFFTGLTDLPSYSAAHPDLLDVRQFGIPPYTIRALGYGVALIQVILVPGFASRLFQRPVFRWVCVCLAVFTWGMLLRTIKAPFAISDRDFLMAFFSRVNGLAFLVSCLIIFDGTPVLRRARSWIAWATLFGIGMNLYEAAYPGTFSTVVGRAAGLYANANTSGMALAIGCLVSLPAVPRRWRELMLLAAVAGICVTFSREAMIGVLIVIAGGIAAKICSLRRLILSAALGVTLLVGLRALEIDADFKTFDGDNLSRLMFESSDQSAQDRLRIAYRVLQSFEDAPLLGQGFGTATYWGDEESHNLYLSLMADHGIFGVLLIPALLMSVWRRSWESCAFVTLFALWCFFDHFVFNTPLAWICIAIEANETAYYRREAVLRKKCSTRSRDMWAVRNPAPIGIVLLEDVVEESPDDLWRPVRAV